MDIFRINIEEDKIFLHGAMSPYDPRSTPRRKVDTHEACAYLKEKGIETGKCVQEAFMNNNEPDLLSGTWVFERFEKKAEKTLDKPAEKVILVKEEKTSSKEKRKTTNKTTKK
tara:strand:- start:127 stop:465 length:339 start_codon:yes stop_codon:yes gene_type:complete